MSSLGKQKSLPDRPLKLIPSAFLKWPLDSYRTGLGKTPIENPIQRSADQGGVQGPGGGLPVTPPVISGWWYRIVHSYPVARVKKNLHASRVLSPLKAISGDV